tara:strand:- start:652 stop:1767 length:1116 start_codon:yes stop_codon:yes gene_type:complete
MATVYKGLLNSDKVSTRTLLHEAIPITGSIVSGTYVKAGTREEQNVKNFSHGLFQSVYDYPFLSSSANHIFDITMGYSSNSAMSSSTNLQNEQKINMYNQMAQVLMGHDHTGAIREFDKDGDLTGGTKLREVFFINFARLLTKDEIKKGSFKLELGVDSPYANEEGPFNQRILIADTNAATSFKTNSPAGEYGILTASNQTGTPMYSSGRDCGLIFYQAGIAVITASVFSTGSAYDGREGMLDTLPLSMSNISRDAPFLIENLLTGTAISGCADQFRHRLYDIDFNNTTELNSTIYFCRANHNDFNYSANPTYLSSSQVRVKDKTLDEPVSYITTIGLYSDNNELLAVAKLSEPIKKTPSQEVTFRVRLDY